MNIHQLRLVLILAGLAFTSACRNQVNVNPVPSPVAQPDKPAAPAEPLPAGPVMDEQISYQFAIYYLPQPKTDPLAKLDELLVNFAPLERAEKADKTAGTPQVAARNEKEPQKNYAPPEAESMQYFGRGLSREQTTALQETQAVLILDFAYSQEHVWSGLRSASGLVHELATATDGLIWDETTREVFTPVAWQTKRLDDWTDQVPAIANHTTIHAYRKDEFVRAITLGMEKFGLPDLIAEDFPWSLNRNVGTLINLLSQSLAEGAEVPRAGEFDLDFRAIKHPGFRESQLESLQANATGIALLTLHKGVWEEGDPANRLIEIGFERGTGPDEHARQEQVIASAFGAEDSITRIKHDDAIRAASSAARTKLPGLRADFVKGLEPGEFIQVKTPFDTPDGGQEWMWVEITKWEGDKITGLLQNDPFDIPTLHAGQVVVVSEAKVFDYIRKRPDGSREGNETGKLIQALSK